jgi:peroxiredoxin
MDFGLPTMVTILACALVLGHRISTPVVGQIAPSIDARTLDSRPVLIKPFLKKGPVVLIVLRGYPGYQCPFCTQQVGGYSPRRTSFAVLRAACC